MHNIGVQFVAKGQMDFYELGEPPDPSPTQILLRTLYSGITNGTERHALMGDFGYGGGYPGRHGYQHVAVVEKTGNQVKEFSEGDKVFYGQYVGHRGWHIVDVNQQHLCYKLHSISDLKPYALLGVLGVGMRHVRRLRIYPGQKVLVIGLGPIGLSAAQSAKAFGAYVVGSDLVKSRLEVAKKLGIHEVVNASDEDYMNRIKTHAPFNSIIDASGYSSLMKDIHTNKLLSYRGSIGLLAVRAETSFHWGMLHLLEGSIEVSCHFDLEDLRLVMHFVQLGAMQIRPMITHEVPITEAKRIYEIMRDNPKELLGVIFEW